MSTNSHPELLQEIKELKAKLFILQYDVKAAHDICDKLDVPKAKALVSHRLAWYVEGKRESYKTAENTEGFPPQEWEDRKQKLADLLAGKHVKKNKLPVVNPETKPQ